MNGHGKCAGCGTEIASEPDPRNRRHEGVAKSFDAATGSYVAWHAACRRAEVNQARGSLLPVPPRTRARATLGGTRSGIGPARTADRPGGMATEPGFDDATRR